MGCAQSKPKVLPPAGDAKRPAFAATLSRRTQGSLSSIPVNGRKADAKENLYPLHAMRMADFLALTVLEPHNALVAKGLVVALDFDGEHKGANLNFVSHQWLAYAEADPECAHLHTMQTLFRRAIAGESIFRSEEDWNAYSKGYTAENARSASSKHVCHTGLEPSTSRGPHREVCNSRVQALPWTGGRVRQGLVRTHRDSLGE